MVDSEEYKKAKQSLLLRLSKQAIHSAQAKKILLGKGFSSSVAEAVVLHLQEKGFIQDENWLQAYICAKKKKYGAQRLQQNLRQKGITLPLSSLALSKEDEHEALIRLLCSRYRQKNLLNPKERSSVFASLARRGFTGASIQHAFKIFLEKQTSRANLDAQET